VIHTNPQSASNWRTTRVRERVNKLTHEHSSRSSITPHYSLVNFDTIKQLNCLFRYKLRAHWSSKQKMQSLSSLLTGPSDHFNCPCTTYGDFLYDDIWLVEKVAHKTNLGWCFPGSSLLMMLIRIGQSSAAHERLIKSGWVELGNRGWCRGEGVAKQLMTQKQNSSNNLKSGKTTKWVFFFQKATNCDKMSVFIFIFLYFANSRLIPI